MYVLGRSVFLWRFMGVDCLPEQGVGTGQPYIPILPLPHYILTTTTSLIIIIGSSSAVYKGRGVRPPLSDVCPR